MESTKDLATQPTEPAVKKADKVKMLKATVSGSFKTQPGSDKDRCNFSSIQGLMVFEEYDYHISFARRMFPMWLEKNKAYKDKNYEGLIKIYVDDVEEIEGTPLCLHKDIKQMTWAELMSLACYKKLREIPLYKSGDIRRARETAYAMYESKINNKLIIRTTQDMQRFKEKLTERLVTLGDLLEGVEVTGEQVAKALKKCHDMTQNALDPSKSYNFAKLPSLVVDR